MIADSYKSGELSEQEAETLLYFCNNSGPSFLIGAVGIGVFHSSPAGLLLKVGILKWFFSNMHMIPVDRGNSDMAALRTCMKTLRDGGVLGIFPEGTRHKQGVMEELESGTALIALRSNVPVIPMLITPKFRFFRRMHLYVGTPIEYQDLRAEGINSATCNALCTRITERYRDMVKQYGSP